MPVAGYFPNPALQVLAARKRRGGPKRKEQNEVQRGALSHPQLFSGSLCPFFLVAAPLKRSSQKGFPFFPGEGSPAKLDYRQKKLIPLIILSS